MGEANQRGTFVERRQEALAKDRELDTLRKRHGLLACIVKQQGRVRVAKRDLDAMGGFALRIARDGDFFLLTCEDVPEAG